MWTREIKKSRKEYGKTIPRRVEMRGLVLDPRSGYTAVLVKIMETGEVELSMNGTAAFKDMNEFIAFAASMVNSASHSPYLLDTNQEV